MAERSGQGNVVFDELHAPDLQSYLSALIHSWSKTLTTLGFTLIPIFFILDVFMMPKELLPRFGLYRGLTTAIVIAQYLVVRATKPGRFSFMHGHFFNIVVGVMIALMTVDLGGFDSTYYAGLNLVMIAVNLLLPWEALHSALAAIMLIAEYLLFNYAVPQPYSDSILVNNLYFMSATAVISVSIGYVKQRLIRQEYFLRTDLKSARDALWGEMEIAKHIQTALLPRTHAVAGYEVGAIMRPADEVGGDYYDVLVTRGGETWLSIGDVSGHGVESGLIMMMAQTSLLTAVNDNAGQKPSNVLRHVNAVLRVNRARLGAERYVTATAIRVDGNELTFAGLHQDILVHRAGSGVVEVVATEGTWLGIVDDIAPHLHDKKLTLHAGDTVLFYTDGVTEAQDKDGKMFGEDRLRKSFAYRASLPIEQLVTELEREVAEYSAARYDDVTLLALRRKS